MKKILALTVGLGLAVSTYAQGNVNMNSGGTGANTKFTNIVLNAWGASNGPAAVVVGLYWGDSPTTVTNLMPQFAMIAQAPAAQAGLVLSASGGGNRNVGRAGTDTWFQLRAWSAGFASWEDAFRTANETQNPAIFFSKVGQGVIAKVAPQATSASPVPQIPWGTGIIEITNVPEPSTIALGILGLAGVYFIRRRK